MRDDERINEAIERAVEFRKNYAGQFSNSDNNEPTGKLISAVKNVIFENYQSDNLNVSGNKKTKNYTTLQSAVRYIVEEIMQLTPAEYDAIYSSKLNQKASIDHAIRKIIAAAPAEVQAEALFDGKQIVFAMCFPEYYKEHHKKITAWDIFDAQGEIKSGLSHAGKIKEINEIQSKGATLKKNGSFSDQKERKRMYNHGEEVDKICYNAMKEIFSLFKMTTRELFLILSQPKSSSFGKYGINQIIESRGCYPSTLDFYMWNSPVEYQLEHFDEYIKVRKEMHLPHIEALDLIDEAYREYKEFDKEYDRI